MCAQTRFPTSAEVIPDSTTDPLGDALCASKPDSARFEFGKNWGKFIGLLDEQRIESAIQSLSDAFETKSLRDKSFLDIGCGSGLFSLAARRLGARVHSFDYDVDSVRATEQVRAQYAPDDSEWTVAQGSILDTRLLSLLGQFNIVYSWGVLHHTGNMQLAFENAATVVAPNGMLMISIYNDQGGASRRWRTVKRWYNSAGPLAKKVIVALVGLYFESRRFFTRLVQLRNPLPFRDWQKKRNDRGMSVYHDLVDWVGGYPFEVAKPEDVFDFFQTRGFELLRLKTDGGGHGCNEFVFRRKP